MKRPLAALLAAAAAGLGAALAAAGPSTYGGAPGRLAFAVLGANVDIYAVSPGSRVSERLTTGTGFDACPAWSRDGTTLVYCSDQTGSYEIWTMRADGSGKRRETNLRSNATFPDLSPDGRRIVFSDCAATCRVMVVDRATGRESVVVDDRRADETEPVWSPNGQLVAYMRARTDRPGKPSQLYIVRADGTAARALTRDRAAKGPFGADWRPDGRLLAYTRRGDIWAVDLNGRSRRLTRTSVAESAPVWAPDGSRIAYLRGSGAARRVWVMRANGSGARPAAPALRGRHLAPSWQPLARPLATSRRGTS